MKTRGPDTRGGRAGRGPSRPPARDLRSRWGLRGAEGTSRWAGRTYLGRAEIRAAAPELPPAAFDSLEQFEVSDIRARLWHEGQVIREEEYSLRACIYFPQELVLMLHDAGFADVVIEGNHTAEPARQDEGTVIFVAR